MNHATFDIQWCHVFSDVFRKNVGSRWYSLKKPLSIIKFLPKSAEDSQKFHVFTPSFPHWLKLWFRVQPPITRLNSIGIYNVVKRLLTMFKFIANENNTKWGCLSKKFLTLQHQVFLNYHYSISSANYQTTAKLHLVFYVYSCWVKHSIHCYSL